MKDEVAIGGAHRTACGERGLRDATDAVGGELAEKRVSKGRHVDHGAPAGVRVEQVGSQLAVLPPIGVGSQQEDDLARVKHILPLA